MWENKYLKKNLCLNDFKDISINLIFFKMIQKNMSRQYFLPRVYEMSFVILIFFFSLQSENIEAF